jgi:phosphotransferase system, enzyme I, PtsP
LPWLLPDSTPVRSRLLPRLRAKLADGSTSLPALIRLIAEEIGAAACSVFIKRPGDILELRATEGLDPAAVGRTRLRVGEGIVGLAAATGRVMNLADAQYHPAFAYRPETHEERLASLLAVPIRRSGRTLGVLAVQNEAPQAYPPETVEELETVALLLAELLAQAGAMAGGEEGIAGATPRIFSAVPLTGGVAIGPVVLHRRRGAVGPLLAEDPDAELQRLQVAVERMQQGLDELRLRLPDGVSEEAASREVLDAYRLVAADAGWLQRVADAVQEGLSAEAAVQRVASEVHGRMRRISDPYLRERLADLEDMTGRLLSELAGETPISPAPGGILVARRLGPAELLSWHAAGIEGIVVEEATPTGHAAILARALGLPAVGGVRGAVIAADEGDELILDADEGEVHLRPEGDLRIAYERALTARVAQRAARYARETVTLDGTRIRLMLNVGLPLELDLLDQTGAEGIGLFRTEIAALARGAIPDKAEQTELYRKVLDAAGERPVVFRTLDLGADKLLPGEDAPEEDNPAMGWRSLRVGLDRPAILRQQLKALLLAADGRPFSVMFPMVATVEEFRAARALLVAEAERLGMPLERLRIGTMLEVPALAWQLDALLREVDFVSVGSNDLAQFLFAADRGAPSLAGRYDFLSAPMLNLLEWVVHKADAAGVPVSLCGEAAGRPVEAITLAALGFTVLSMSGAGVFAVRSAMTGLDIERFRPVLQTLRESAPDGASLRDPIEAWAREQGMDV